jgi:Cu/Ag efflux protein CusF
VKETTMKRIPMLVILAAALPLAAGAQPSPHVAHHEPKAEAASPLVAGEVRKVDKEQGKLTLRHGPIPNLDMPDMTMVFQVRDAAMLERVKAGDKVRFAAEKVGGQYTVVRIEPAP